jgi:hypothetical protein
MNRGAELKTKPKAERSEDQNMKQNATINANHPDYWKKLKAAHKDIGDLLITERLARSGDRSFAWRDEMLSKAEANPLLARLSESIPNDQKHLWM